MRAPGFTLLELVLVIIILGIIAVFISPVLTSAVTSYDTTSRNVEVLTKARYAMERMAREIRHVRRTTTNSATYDISTMSNTQLVFTRPDANQVTLSYSGSAVSLAYSTPSASATLTDAVSSFCINYCQVDGTTCTRTAFVPPPPDPCTSSGSTVDSSNVAIVELRMTLTGTITSTATSETAPTMTSVVRVDLRTP